VLRIDNFTTVHKDAVTQGMQSTFGPLRVNDWWFTLNVAVARGKQFQVVFASDYLNG
jgi:hypothetical protein